MFPKQIFGLNELHDAYSGANDRWMQEANNSFMTTSIHHKSCNDDQMDKYDTDLSWSSHKITGERPPDYQIPEDTISRQLDFYLDSANDFDKFDF